MKRSNCENLAGIQDKPNHFLVWNDGSICKVRFVLLLDWHPELLVSTSGGVLTTTANESHAEAAAQPLVAVTRDIAREVRHVGRTGVSGMGERDRMLPILLSRTHCSMYGVRIPSEALAD